MINLLETQFKTLGNDFKIYEVLNQVVLVLIGIFIFFNPFPHTTAIKEIAFYVSVAIVLVLVVFKKTEFTLRTPLALPLGLFVLWAFLSIFWALDVNNTIHDFYSHLIKYIIIYYILINFFCSKKHLFILSWIIVTSATIFSLWAIYYFYFELGNSFSARLGLIGFTETHNHIIGMIAVFSTILDINLMRSEIILRYRLILLLCLFPLLAVIILIQTLVTIIAMAAAIVALASNKKSRFFLLLMTILFIVLLMLNKNRIFTNEKLQSLHHRIEIGYYTIEIIKDYPVKGIGFGMESYWKAIDFNKYYQRIPDKYRIFKSLAMDPHDMVLDIAVRLGLIGVVLFLYIIFIAFRMCYKVIKNSREDFFIRWRNCILSIFIAFIVIGLFQPVFSHMQEVMVCTVISMTTILWRLSKEVNSKALVGSDLQ